MMRLFVAVDGSQGATKAIDTTVRLIRELHEAEVILVNVGYIPFVALAIPEATSYIDLTSVEQALERGGHDLLGQAARAFADLGVRVAQVYRKGEPARAIVAATSELRADVSVVGARGLGQIGGLILGSVNERVLHAAHTPAGYGLEIVRPMQIDPAGAGGLYDSVGEREYLQVGSAHEEHPSAGRVRDRGQDRGGGR
jgi:nucleotide-binding universal stress UspA family protein